MAAPIYYTADMVPALPDDWTRMKTLRLAIAVPSPSTRRYDRFS